MKNILLTGGAGYIGSHVANFLLDKGCKVTIIDNLATGSEKLVPKKSQLFVCDIADTKTINKIFEQNNFDIVMHFAGLVKVEESIKNPKKYNDVNFTKSKIFVDNCIKNNVNKIIFSSTASVYGNTTKTKVSENDKLKPLNPYARSKLKLEKYLIKKSKKNKLKYIILRYFNVAGADSKLRSGLISRNSKNLIKVICEVATAKRKRFIINGDNYNTRDGTPVRDYIHVSDLAEIHYLVAKYLFKKNTSQIFNCGYGKGYTVLEVLKSMNKIISREIPARIGKRRFRDIQSSISNIKKFKNYIKWKPKFNSLNKILKSSYEWEKKLK